MSRREFTTTDRIVRVNSFIADTSDAAWTFFQSMTQEDRDQMDALLVRDGHPLAFQPGTQWNRFRLLADARHQFYL